MSEYTSSIDGFQRAMEMSLVGKPEDARSYYESTCTATFYTVSNGQREDLAAAVKTLEEWRAKATDYRPKVNLFLRDGDHLAAHLVGTVKIEGVLNRFESFLFSDIDKESGKMKWLIDRSIWGPAGGAPEHGAFID